MQQYTFALTIILTDYLKLFLLYPCIMILYMNILNESSTNLNKPLKQTQTFYK